MLFFAPYCPVGADDGGAVQGVVRDRVPGAAQGEVLRLLLAAGQRRGGAGAQRVEDVVVRFDVSDQLLVTEEVGGAGLLGGSGAEGELQQGGGGGGRRRR